MNPSQGFPIKVIHQRITAKGKNTFSFVKLMKVKGKNAVLEYFEHMEKKDSVPE